MSFTSGAHQWVCFIFLFSSYISLSHAHSFSHYISQYSLPHPFTLPFSLLLSVNYLFLCARCSFRTHFIYVCFSLYIPFFLFSHNSFVSCLCHFIVFLATCRVYKHHQPIHTRVASNASLSTTLSSFYSVISPPLQRFRCRSPSRSRSSCVLGSRK